MNPSESKVLRYHMIGYVLVLLCVLVTLAILLHTPKKESLPHPPGALLIVEPRRHPMLPKVIRAFDKTVPKSWTLYVVHGRLNEEFAKNATDSVDRPVVFVQLDIENLTAAQYNALFKNPSFWDVIDAEHILVFQTDTMPCQASLDLDRFGQFGYIGCAYGDKVGKNTYWGTDSFYGSGGLSMRRKSFTTQCLKKYPTGVAPEPEDVTFSTCVDELQGFPKPSAADVGDFCAQNAWGPSTVPQSFGAHQLKRQMPATKRQQFLKYCPLARDI